MRPLLTPPPLGEVARRRWVGGGTPAPAQTPTGNASRRHLPQKGRI